MQALANISQFESLGNGTEKPQGTLSMFNHERVVENEPPFDLSSNPDGTVTPGAVQPVAPALPSGDRNAVPEWGQTLGKRVDRLENEVKQVKKDTAEILRRLPTGNP